MARTPIWRSISTQLTDDIAAGRYSPGEKLPTEAALAARFSVNRHTVRRALSALTDQGLVHTRRGAGSFVAAHPTDYPIGRRVSFTRNLTAAGRLPGKEILTLETRAADAAERKALKLPKAARVHVSDGLSLADGAPIAIYRSIFPADRLPGFLALLETHGSVTEALKRSGVEDYTRASTRVSAKPADATQARHLRLPEGAPLLQTLSINVDPKNRPIEYGITWFAGDRVTLTFDDPAA